MTPKEKYINYVVEDLVMNTDIDYDEYEIHFPCKNLFPFFPLPIYHFLSIYQMPSPFDSFSTYIQQRYGVKDEEMKIIWDLYKERIKSLIKK